MGGVLIRNCQEGNQEEKEIRRSRGETTLFDVKFNVMKLVMRQFGLIADKTNNLSIKNKGIIEIIPNIKRKIKKRTHY